MNQEECYDKLDKIHPYPAKFPLKLAEEYILKYSVPGNVIFDPFVGSGTTLLAASSQSRISFGTDINPVAVLISKFKISNYSSQQLRFLDSFTDIFSKDEMDMASFPIVQYRGIDHWFTPNAIKSLSYIKWKIEQTFASKNDENCKTFAYTIFSSIINTVSNQESDTRYAAVIKEEMSCESILSLFRKKTKQALNICHYIERDKDVLKKSKALLFDSKHVSKKIKKETVDMIMTSPPYPNTYDYYLYHKHRMLWLGYDFNFSKGREIGSRNEFSSKKQPTSNFTNDMYQIMCECDKVLKSKSKAVIIIGDGVIKGELYDSRINTTAICESIGWKLIESSFNDLDDTSRSFNKYFRYKGKKEHVLVFEKG